MRSLSRLSDGLSHSTISLADAVPAIQSRISTGKRNGISTKNNSHYEPLIVGCVRCISRGEYLHEIPRNLFRSGVPRRSLSFQALGEHSKPFGVMAHPAGDAIPAVAATPSIAPPVADIVSSRPRSYRELYSDAANIQGTASQMQAEREYHPHQICMTKPPH
jgi:hypothetical protein